MSLYHIHTHTDKVHCFVIAENSFDKQGSEVKRGDALAAQTCTFEKVGAALFVYI